MDVCQVAMQGVANVMQHATSRANYGRVTFAAKTLQGLYFKVAQERVVGRFVFEGPIIVWAHHKCWQLI